MKYNIGDVVQIVSRWNSHTAENNEGLMDHWLGKAMTIRDIEDSCYKMEEDKNEWDGEGWYWNEACIAKLLMEKHQKLTEMDQQDFLSML